MKIPQADKIDRILDIPLAIADGAVDVASVSRRYRIVARQAQYYLEAAEMLGLVLTQKSKASLTALGRRYIELTYQERKELLVEQMLSLPVIQELLIALLVSKEHMLDMDQIRAIVSTRTNIADSTVARRAHTLLEWFSWLGKEIGVFATNNQLLRLVIP